MIRLRRLLERPWRAAIAVAAVLVVAAGFAGVEQPVPAANDEAFSATVPAPGRTPEALNAAYGEALRKVIVAVTGREAAGRDAALVARFGDPANHVARYQSVGTDIRVQFDPDSVRSVLVSSGYLSAPADEAAAPLPGAAVQVAVANIHRPDDYGAVLQIFRGLDASSRITVVGASGDTVIFAVSLGGGVDALSRALARQNLLEGNGAVGAEVRPGEALRYRYAPRP